MNRQPLNNIKVNWIKSYLEYIYQNFIFEKSSQFIKID